MGCFCRIRPKTKTRSSTTIFLPLSFTNRNTMRVVADIPHPEIKITLLAWNGKYLIKLELGPFEQTYKVSEMDVAGDEEVKTWLDEEFLQQCMEQFLTMRKNLHEARRRHSF